MKKRYQTTIKQLGWVIAGFLLLGSFLDAISNAITIITPTVTYVGSSILLLSWMAIYLILRKYPVKWMNNDGVEVTVKKIGVKTNLYFLGMIVLLWLPPLLITNDATLAKPFDSFEVIFDLPSDYIDTDNNKIAESDYFAIVQTLCPGQTDCSVSITIEFMSGRFSFRENLYFTSDLKDLRVYILPFDEGNWKQPPTWYSYLYGWNNKFSGPVYVSRNWYNPLQLSIRAWQHDLAQLGPEITIRELGYWGVQMTIEWEGQDINHLFSMMRDGKSLDWLNTLPAIIRINGEKVWSGNFQAEGGYTLPTSSETNGVLKWNFSQRYYPDTPISKNEN